MKLNLGCSKYILRGWENFDNAERFQQLNGRPLPEGIRDIDLTQFPYPFENDSVEAIVLSHCLNQIDESHYEALFSELQRILVPGGILRITDYNNDIHPMHYSAVTHLNIQKVLHRMEGAGFRSEVMVSRRTQFHDKTILVDNHRHVGTGRFFVEGICTGETLRPRVSSAEPRSIAP